MQRRGYALGGQLRGASGTQYKYDVEGNLIRKILPTGEVWQYERIVLGSLPT
jgi:YD repeat-containing protein